MPNQQHELVIFDFFGVFCSDFVADWLSSKNASHLAETLIKDHVHPADLGHTSFDAQCAAFGQALGFRGADVKAGFLGITRMDADVVGIARALARHTRIALLSNAPSGVVESVLERHRVTLPFEVTVISADVGLMKPDAAIYQHVLREAAVPPSRAIMIDDRPVNVDAATALGLTGIIFKSAAELGRDLAELGLDAS